MIKFYKDEPCESKSTPTYILLQTFIELISLISRLRIQNLIISTHSIPRADFFPDLKFVCERKYITNFFMYDQIKKYCM